MIRVRWCGVERRASSGEWQMAREWLESMRANKGGEAKHGGVNMALHPERHRYSAERRRRGFTIYLSIYLCMLSNNTLTIENSVHGYSCIRPHVLLVSTMSLERTSLCCYNIIMFGSKLCAACHAVYTVLTLSPHILMANTSPPLAVE